MVIAGLLRADPTPSVASRALAAEMAVAVPVFGSIFVVVLVAVNRKVPAAMPLALRALAVASHPVRPLLERVVQESIRIVRGKPGGHSIP